MPEKSSFYGYLQLKITIGYSFLISHINIRSSISQSINQFKSKQSDRVLIKTLTFELLIYSFARLLSYKSTKYMNTMYVSRLISQVDNFVLTMDFENFFSISFDQLDCSTDHTVTLKYK